MFVARYFDFTKSYGWLNSGGLGTMGSGLPSGIGAKECLPQSSVICFSGDGSILMSVGNFSLLRDLGLCLCVCIINNGGLGMVRQWQQVEQGGRYSFSELEACRNFTSLSRAYGFLGLSVFYSVVFEGKVIEAINQRLSVIVMDLKLNRDENIWPMVQSGKGLTNMLFSDGDIN
jgi:acetolactate synthase-1/2/3 large subunit